MDPTAAEFATLRYDETDGVATVTLHRPDVHNAFDETMQQELSSLWRTLRTRESVRAVVLTGAGDKAFCTGIDRSGIPVGEDDYAFDPLAWDDPGQRLGPKSCGLWKPVIAAVNGMACGGAFYLLGEVEFMIAADHATFFDPHVTFGMAAIFEPTLLGQRMPFGEIARLALTGSHERVSAQRAYEIGLVSQVVPGNELMAESIDVARAIASQPARAVQATVRGLWAARELSLRQAIEMAPALLEVGNSAEGLADGQAAFSSGRRITPRIR